MKQQLITTALRLSAEAVSIVRLADGVVVDVNEAFFESQASTTMSLSVAWHRVCWHHSRARCLRESWNGYARSDRSAT
jgi:hypothetical protein